MPGAAHGTGVAVVGVSTTPIVRRSDDNLVSVAIEACLDAIRDAGIDRDRIDGFCGIPDPRHGSPLHADGVDEVSATLMAEVLGLGNLRWAIDLHQNMATSLLVTGAQAVMAGTCDYALLLRAVYNPPHRSYSQSAALAAAGPEQFKLPYGLGPAGGRFAQWLQRYMHDTGASREALYEVARVARSNAQHNPLAIWNGKGELTLDEYLAARWISEPMGVYDCDMPVTAAVAFVITTSERARRLRPNPAHLASFANSHDPRRVFTSLGIAPDAIDVAQLYDGFSPMVWQWLELMGFCREGEAHRFTAEGGIRPDGRLPTNTFGGSLGEGRLHGAGHLREAVLQAMGRGGARQIENVRRSLAVVGIPENFWSVIFEPEA